MKLVALSLMVVLLLTAAAAAEPVSRTFSAPVDRVWGVTEAVLKHLGWKIEKADRAIGWITTDDRMVEGGQYGVYEKGTQHQLRVNVRAAGADKATVTIERSVFARERILWMNKDQPITVKDQDVEKNLLDQIGKSL
jgi:hypothetical protein